VLVIKRRVFVSETLDAVRREREVAAVALWVGESTADIRVMLIDWVAVDLDAEAVCVSVRLHDAVSVAADAVTVVDKVLVALSVPLALELKKRVEKDVQDAETLRDPCAVRLTVVVLVRGR
jgi:hypothetical protein